jgi:hypothetical protein
MTATKTPLDISEEVSDEDYRRVLQSFLDQFEAWRISHRWCSDLYLFVAQLSATFHWNKSARLDSLYREGYTGAMELDIPDGRTAAQRAQDLRDIRGRVLQFTVQRSEYLTITRANEFLTTAGLAPWAPEAPAAPLTARYSVSAGGQLSSDLTQEQIRDKLTKYMRRLGIERPDVYIDVARPDRDRPPVRIPDSQLTALLPNPSRNY